MLSLKINGGNDVSSSDFWPIRKQRFIYNKSRDNSEKHVDADRHQQQRF